MVPGMGTRRCRSSGQPLVPAGEHTVMAVGDDLAQLARQRTRVRPLPRHRRQQPRRLVIESEMPGNATGAPRRHAEPRHLAGRTADRQPVAQPVGVDRRQRLSRDPRASRPLAGLGRAQSCCRLLVPQRSSSRAGLSTTIRARRR
jgi:hypothetical protein